MKRIKINEQVLLDCGLSFSQIAKLTGLSINTVKSIAQGNQRRVDFSVLEKLADVLNMKPLDLLAEEKEGNDVKQS